MIFRLDKRELWNPNCVFYLHFLFFLFSIARITVVCGCYTTRCDASLFPLPVGYIVGYLLVVFSSFFFFVFSWTISFPPLSDGRGLRVRSSARAAAYRATAWRPGRASAAGRFGAACASGSLARLVLNCKYGGRWPTPGRRRVRRVQQSGGRRGRSFWACDRLGVRHATRACARVLVGPPVACGRTAALAHGGAQQHHRRSLRSDGSSAPQPMPEGAPLPHAGDHGFFGSAGMLPKGQVFQQRPSVPVSAFGWPVAWVQHPIGTAVCSVGAKPRRRAVARCRFPMRRRRHGAKGRAQGFDATLGYPGEGPVSVPLHGRGEEAWRRVQRTGCRPGVPKAASTFFMCILCKTLRRPTHTFPR